jgi:hypothetical protein
MVAGLACGVWAAGPFFATGDRLAGALCAAVLGLAGALSVAVGLVLHTVARHFQELELRLDLSEGDRNRLPPPPPRADRPPDA